MLTAQRVAMVFNDTQLCGRPKIYMNICHQQYKLMKQILEYLLLLLMCVCIYINIYMGSKN